MSIPNHLIERSYDIYASHTAGNDVEPDKLQYLSGFAAAIGVLTGSLQVGIPEGTPSVEVMAALLKELDKYRSEIRALEDEARRRTVRRNL